ncbi:hypothetical protein COL516b_011764 [Colletotrichum fioriniae]|nr:uncharacterized protein COL516b_011764 [Colletotrichum fioriniae]KAJ0296235.1 hypothetical protein COL516b_011764 [Colletotrichum fioriniae]
MLANVSATPTAISKDDDFQALKKRNPLLWKKASFIAGRFAAKEATFKAHPTRNLSWHDITIVRKRFEKLQDTEELRKTKGQGAENKQVEEPKELEGSEAATTSANGSGPPVAIVRGTHDDMPGQEVLVSISHDGDYATAVCLAFQGVAGVEGQGRSAKED